MKFSLVDVGVEKIVALVRNEGEGIKNIGEHQIVGKLRYPEESIVAEVISGVR